MRRKGAHLWFNESHAASKAKIPRHTRAESANGVREHWRLDAINVCGECHAAEFTARLQEDRLDPRARQVRRRNEPVMPAAKDDHIGAVTRLLGCCLLCGRRLLLLRCHYSSPALDFRISSAARRPGAAMMPPPGCAEELASQ